MEMPEMEFKYIYAKQHFMTEHSLILRDIEYIYICVLFTFLDFNYLKHTLD